MLDSWPSSPELLLAQILAKFPEVIRLARARGKANRGKNAAWRRVYLHTLAQSGCISIAARAAQVSRVGILKARRRDPEFATAEADAREEGLDLVEASAFKSAIYGDQEPVYHEGKVVGHAVRYSDAMRKLLLEGRRSHVYRLPVGANTAPTHKHLTLSEFHQRMAEAGA